MNFRPKDDVAESFARAAAVLDDALSRFMTLHGGGDIAVDDRSNRTGFDWSGFGRPEWSYVFRREWASGSLIVKNEAWIRYVESIEPLPPAISAEWIGDVFSRGAAWSLWKERAPVDVTWDELPGDGLTECVLRVLRAAAAATPAKWSGEARPL
jgi:hypothetical protein